MGNEYLIDLRLTIYGFPRQVAGRSLGPPPSSSGFKPKSIPMAISADPNAGAFGSAKGDLNMPSCSCRAHFPSEITPETSTDLDSNSLPEDCELCRNDAKFLPDT